MKRFLCLTLLLFAFLPAGPTNTANAQEVFIGEIRMFGFTFCPRGWTEADGQLLDISTYSPLFSLYGTIYGGDGRTTFALPDLRSRVPVHIGEGPGLSSYILGEKGGQEEVSLSVDQMPRHDHEITQLTNPNGTTAGMVSRNGGGEQAIQTTLTGGGASHENRPPFLAIRYCVALEGIFPSRN